MRSALIFPVEGHGAMLLFLGISEPPMSFQRMSLTKGILRTDTNQMINCKFNGQYRHEMLIF